ncbi:MAG: hypothetical protein ACRYFZ_15935 [Janthinobacterium lividum]
MKTLLSLPYLNLYLHEKPVPVLELNWLSYVSSANFHAATLQALHFSELHHVQAWIGDDRMLGAIRPIDTGWAEQHILTPLSQAGLQRFALLDSQIALNQLIIGDMYKRIKPVVDYEIRHFTDLSEARAWALGIATVV